MREVPVDLPPEPASARVVLVGHMGAGKTTLARLWSQVEGARPTLWFDSDRAALAHLGATTVAEAFERHGESGWREAERIVITRQASRLARGVELWSLGGGAAQDPDVQRTLMEADAVVWLDAPLDVLWERATGGGDRPLAFDRDAFEQRYRDRVPTWEALSTIRIDTTAAPEDVELPRALAERISIDALCSSLAVGSGLLGRIADLAVLDGADVAIVADQAVGELADRVAALLGDSRVRSVELVATGEWNKQLATGERLVRSWSGAGVHRRCVVVAIGGGTLLDVAGFAASIYQRGLRWVSVPTTVLAQVDAGIGGKTAVNLGAAKNVLGTVHLPDTVLIDPSLLATLPQHLVADGWVEAGKTALLAGGGLPQLAADAVDAAGTVGDPVWERLIAACAGYKDAVVAEDPFDTDGIRAQLNLGHTLGHAIEAATGGAVSHGRAVAIGINAALVASVRELGLDGDVVAGWCRDCTRLGIDTRSPLTWQELEPHLVHDKKRTERGIGWVLLVAPGRPVTDARLPLQTMREVWEDHVHDPDAPAARTAEAGARPRVLVLFGINLGELGRRDATHYGSDDLPALVRRIEAWAQERGLVADCRQTDSLERFVAALHEARDTASAVLVNPGAWTHYERAIHDALEPLPIPRVEIHLSDVDAREEWRHESVIRPAVDHVVSGRGADGYREALDWVASRLAGA